MHGLFRFRFGIALTAGAFLLASPGGKSAHAQTLPAAPPVATPAAIAGSISKGPYLMSPTPDGITVCWVSDSEVSGKVQYRTIRDDSRTGVITAEEAKATRFHRVTLSGLQPYTMYTYTLTCGGQSSAGTFRTAPAPASAQPYHFVAYGDNRTQADKHAAVLAAMMQFRPDFVVQSGDQVANGEILPQWDEFFNVASTMLRNTAYFPSLGNHEREAAPYFQFFGVPREYSFDYGNTHFVALDTNRPAAEYKDQEEWLRRDLLAHQNATWRIVFFHHTPYTCVTMPDRRVDAAKLSARLEPIFLAGNVQLILCGHDHNYQRHVAKGITYIVSGGGGAPLYDVKLDTPFVKTARKVHNFCELSVNGPTITMQAKEPDGTIIETIEIKANKPRTAGSLNNVIPNSTSP